MRPKPRQSPSSTRLNLVTKRCALVLAIFCLASRTATPQSNKPTTGSWSGTIVYSSCNADEAFNESPECLRAVPDAKLALYDDTSRVMYGLEPQDRVTAHAGDSVTVQGTLEESVIHLSSIGPMSIGLAVGQKAPPLSARDQLGQTQTLDSLKGPNGTVLLFFRSADW